MDTAVNAVFEILSFSSIIVLIIVGLGVVASMMGIFLGADMTEAAPPERARARIGIKFQITSVLPGLSVFDNVLLPFPGCCSS
jgi:branched-chain amino acid transport system ATP-binding protein